MELCEKSDACSFFKNQLRLTPAISEKLKALYCKSNKARCARYKVTQMAIKGFYPADEKASTLVESMVGQMYPHDYEKAELVISNLQKG